ncbi:hypothetical protein [Methylobacterium sp. E-046]|uniref:hypothetical protein n=1 Tax=Methylobacterium sp. E-046 TaxID=2836576 RepID=UPI001FBB235C|nr:hypothetical protein [Methylobacterium sp. E-046]MCJ2099357.1 hypothetical protein [Methylobacterium sp. E-046]
MDGKQAVEFAILMLVIVSIGWSLRPRGMRARAASDGSTYSYVSADTTGGPDFSSSHHGCSHHGSDSGSCSSDGGGGGDGGGGD